MADAGAFEAQAATPPQGSPAAPAGGYEPVQDSDMAPAPGYESIADSDIQLAGSGAAQRAGSRFGSMPPQALLDRLKDSSAITNIIKSTVSGLNDGYGAGATDLSPAVTGLLQRAGIFPTPEQERQNPMSLRSWNQALLSPVASVGDAFMDMARLVPRVFGAGEEAVAQGGGQAAQEAGLGDKGVAEEEIRGGMDWLFSTPDGFSILNEMGRVEPNPAGGHSDVRIGPLPPAAEVPTQAASIAEHYGLPAAAVEAIQSAYHDSGVLPAEIYHDLPNKPEMMGRVAAGEPAYPVSDWTGAPLGVKRGEVSQEAEIPANVSPAAPVQPVPGTARPAEPAVLPEVPREVPAGMAPEEGAGVPPTAPTRIAATALRPVEGTGETKTMALAESTEQAANEPLGELPESQTAEDPVQRAAAARLLVQDADRAKAIALGQREPPKNLLRTAVYDAVLKQAVATGDSETIRQLATGGMSGIAKRFGQEISFLRNVAPDDPAEAIRSVQEARAAAVAARGVDTAAETEKAVQTVRAAKAVASKPGAWQSFVNEIMCK